MKSHYKIHEKLGADLLLYAPFYAAGKAVQIQKQEVILSVAVFLAKRRIS
jgi:hypothetical protein